MEKNLGSYFYNNRPEMQPFLPSQYLKVLEVGCGAGAFYASLKEGIEYWGVDPSESAEQALMKKVHRFFRGILEDVAQELPDQYFDLIVINDVMEHSVDHLAFLSILKSKLLPIGYLVGSVPNVRYVLNLKELLLCKDWHYQPSGGILDYTHLRFFTEISLSKSLIQAGFQIEACHGINPVWWSMHPFRMLVKKLFYGGVALVLGKDLPYLQFAFRCNNLKGKS
jgi:2-polyprenyl-3-methyl-5-hydroxy-6-metoxy-1,4-benzoquinol methylase